MVWGLVIVICGGPWAAAHSTTILILMIYNKDALGKTCDCVMSKARNLHTFIINIEYIM